MTATTPSLKDALIAATTLPWVQTLCTLDQVDAAARELGWEAVPTRPGEADRKTLRPTPADLAHPRSLSAVYGLGQQPLHTDGAHLPHPPDVVVLHGPSPSPTGTGLWTPLESSRAIDCDAWTHGMFVVSTGGRSRLSPAIRSGRLALDPGCMTPADKLARKVLAEARVARATAYTFAWAASGTTLIINNRRTMHARNAVVEDYGRRILRIAYRAVGIGT